jgi:hypothetical protein
MSMTLHQAAAFFCPLGRHRHRPLACVALDDPDYLFGIVDRGSAECAPGTMFHTAVSIVVERLRRNAEDDILHDHDLVTPDQYRSVVAELSRHNRDAMKGRHMSARATAPKAAVAPAPKAEQGELFP